jgi:hypothetical protein
MSTTMFGGASSSRARMRGAPVRPSRGPAVYRRLRVGQPHGERNSTAPATDEVLLAQGGLLGLVLVGERKSSRT